MGPYSTLAAGRPVYKEVQYEMQVYPLFRLSFEMSKQILVRQPAPGNADECCCRSLLCELAEYRVQCLRNSLESANALAQ